MSMILSPRKLTCPPKKGPFLSSPKHQFPVDMLVFGGLCILLKFVQALTIQFSFSSGSSWGDFQCYPKWFVVRAIQAEDEEESWAEEEMELET